MAKINPKIITSQDLADYLATESDFAFEIRVVKECKRIGFDVLHGGTYMDDVTGKPRQFDVRATMTGECRIIRLAIECKNLKNTFPMLVSCLPRTNEEAFQDVAFSINERTFIFADSPNRHTQIPIISERTVETQQMHGTNTPYRIGEPVGKTVAQIGRDANSSSFSTGDSELYGKWSQALSSADDLVKLAVNDGRMTEHDCCFSSVTPVLVVPDDTLWRCDYDVDGNLTQPPIKSHRVPLFVGKECKYGPRFMKREYILSHLEVVTFTGLEQLANDLATHEMIVPTKLAVGLINSLCKPRR